MKRSIVILAIAIGLYSCNDGERTTDTTETNMSVDSGAGMMSDNNPDDHTMATTSGDTAALSSNAMGENANTRFLTEAASGGMMEVELAKVAKSNSSTTDVKSLAEMIRSDHEKANAELKSLAAAKNITLPADMKPEHKTHTEEMKKLKGKDFDNHYIDMMVSDHEADIQKFRDASNTLTDADLKAFAAKTLPTLEKHLKRARELKQKQ